MRLPLELEHLIRTTSDAPQRSQLSGHLASIDARKALEVEHYLRACIFRLDSIIATTDGGAPRAYGAPTTHDSGRDSGSRDSC